MKKLLYLLLLIGITVQSVTIQAQRLHIGIIAGQHEVAAFDTDYQAILDRGTFLTYVLPSAGQQIVQNQLVLDFKSNGIWDNEDIIYIPANNGSREFGYLNWKTPASHEMTEVGIVSWYANRGFRANGIDSHITTSWNPIDDGSNFTTTSAGVSMYISVQHDEPTHGTGVFYTGRASTGTSQFNTYHSSDGGLYARYHSASQVLLDADPTYLGYHQADFLESAAPDRAKLYLDGDTFATVDMTTSFPIATVDWFVSATSTNGSAGNWADIEWGFFSVGASQRGDEVIKNSLVKNYISDITPTFTEYTVQGLSINTSSSAMIPSPGATFTGLAFNDDGTSVLLVADNPDRAYEYALSTAYDLSTIGTGGVVSDLSVIGNTSMQSVEWNDDGTKAYITDLGLDGIQQFTTSAYDFTSFSHDGEFNPAEGSNELMFLWFNDGNRFLIGKLNSNVIEEYTTSIRYDLVAGTINNTASHTMTGGTWTTGSDPHSMQFFNNGYSIFVRGNDFISQHDMTIPYDLRTNKFMFNFDVSTFSSGFGLGTTKVNPDTGVFYASQYDSGSSNDKIHEMQLTEIVDIHPQDNAASDTDNDSVGSWEVQRSGVLTSDGTESLFPSDFSMKLVAGAETFPGAFLTLTGLENGGTYTMTVYAKSDVVDQQQLLLDDVNGWTADSVTEVTSTDWEAYTITGTTNSTTAIFHIQSHRTSANPGRTVWFDKVRIYKH